MCWILQIRMLTFKNYRLLKKKKNVDTKKTTHLQKHLNLNFSFFSLSLFFFFVWQIKITQMKITTLNTRWGINSAFYERSLQLPIWPVPKQSTLKTHMVSACRPISWRWRAERDTSLACMDFDGRIYRQVSQGWGVPCFGTRNKEVHDGERVLWQQW